MRIFLYEEILELSLSESNDNFMGNNHSIPEGMITYY